MDVSNHLRGRMSSADDSGDLDFTEPGLGALNAVNFPKKQLNNKERKNLKRKRKRQTQRQTPCSCQLNLDAEISSLDMLKIGETLSSSELMHLYLELGLNYNEIEKSQLTTSLMVDENLKAVGVLNCWKQQKGRAANWKNVIDALTRSQFNDSKDKLLTYLRIESCESCNHQENHTVHLPVMRQQTSEESSGTGGIKSVFSFRKRSHSSVCQIQDPEKTRKTSPIRSDSDVGKNPWTNMPDVAYNTMKMSVAKNLTQAEVKQMKDMTRRNHKKHGIYISYNDNENDAMDFLRVLERDGFLGKNVLFFLQYLLSKLENQEALGIVTDYANQRQCQQPLELKPVKRRKTGMRTVEFRIVGAFKHTKMADINEFIDSVSDNLLIPREYINLTGIAQGSIIIVVQMPEMGVNRLRQALHREAAWLTESKILDVHIEGEECVTINDCYYHDCVFQDINIRRSDNQQIPEARVVRESVDMETDETSDLCSVGKKRNIPSAYSEVAHELKKLYLHELNGDSTATVSPIRQWPMVGEETRLVLIGNTSDGKRPTINSMFNIKDSEPPFKTTGQPVIADSVYHREDIRGRSLCLVDTPGLFNTDPEKTNDGVKQDSFKYFGLTSPGPHAFLFVIKIGEFTEHLRTYETICDMFGDEIHRFTIVVLTGGDELERKDQTVEEYLEDAPDNFKELLKKFGNRYVVFNNHAKGSEKEKHVEHLLETVDSLIQTNQNCFSSETYISIEKSLQELENHDEIMKTMEQAAEVLKKEYLSRLTKIPEVQDHKQSISWLETSQYRPLMLDHAEHHKQIDQYLINPYIDLAREYEAKLRNIKNKYKKQLREARDQIRSDIQKEKIDTSQWGFKGEV